jgi:hypothetical protein
MQNGVRCVTNANTSFCTDPTNNSNDGRKKL